MIFLWIGGFVPADQLSPFWQLHGGFAPLLFGGFVPADQLSFFWQLPGGFVPAVVRRLRASWRAVSLSAARRLRACCGSAASRQLSSTAASCLLWLGGFVPAEQHGGFVPAVARRLCASWAARRLRACCDQLSFWQLQGCDSSLLCSAASCRWSAVFWQLQGCDSSLLCSAASGRWAAVFWQLQGCDSSLLCSAASCRWSAVVILAAAGLCCSVRRLWAAADELTWGCSCTKPLRSRQCVRVKKFFGIQFNWEHQPTSSSD